MVTDRKKETPHPLARLRMITKLRHAGGDNTLKSSWQLTVDNCLIETLPAATIILLQTANSLLPLIDALRKLSTSYDCKLCFSAYRQLKTANFLFL